MYSPQMECMNVLSINNEKKFALVVNDEAVRIRGKQIYIKSAQSKLVTFFYEKQPNKMKRTEVEVDLVGLWSALTDVNHFYGFDFRPYLECSSVRFKVMINTIFDILFIESPVLTLIKECIKQLESDHISRLSIGGVPLEFMIQFRENWPSIQSQFQINSVLCYIDLMTNMFKNKLDRKLYYPPNCIFKSSIDSKKINFLHLFLKTSGLYNPFLNDSQFSSLLQKTWFSYFEGNNRLFIRQGRGYDLHCMSVNDFCKSLNLERKIGFQMNTALLFLASLLYMGSIKTLELPVTDVKGYWRIDMENGKYISRGFSIDPIIASSSNESVQQVTPLEQFVILNRTKLGGTAILAESLNALLSGAHFSRR